MNETYILVGQTPTPCDDVIEWAKHFNKDERRVRLTRVGPYFVSTVFLGFDRRFVGERPPILFETAVYLDADFIDETGEESPIPDRKFLYINKRCATWLEAEKQHEDVMREIKEAHDEMEQIYPEPLETK